MINYMSSEFYRLLRKKGPHITSLACFFLIGAAAAVLYYFGESEPNFPYANSRFFYSNVVSSGLVVILVGSLFNLALTSKDSALIKQSISFGISRQVIFWSKLILTSGYFLLICVIGVILMIVLGENMLITDNPSVRNFLIACVNMAPIVLSGFFLTHTLKMLKVRDMYIIFVLLLIFGFSSNLMRILFGPFPGLNELYKYGPDSLLNDNLMNFVDNTIQFDYKLWVVGIVISIIALVIGATRFGNQNID